MTDYNTHWNVVGEHLGVLTGHEDHPSLLEIAHIIDLMLWFHCCEWGALYI